MVIEKIKAVFTKDHLTSALMVFAGFALAKMAVGYIAPMLVDIIPYGNYDEVVAVAVVVVMLSMFGQKMITLGAMTVLIDVALKMVGIDLVAIAGTVVRPPAPV